MADPISQGIGAIGSIVGASIGGGARRQEQRDASAQLASRQAAYEGMQFNNVYSGLQNTAEDLTVNTQQADFMAQQQQQGMANTMGAMQGAAGGSGIAALAQAMSNQQNQNLQGASASIGQQENRNQMLSAQQAGQNQLMVAQGEQVVQDKEEGRTKTLLGQAQARSAAADQARADATDAMVNGVTDLAKAGASVATGGLSSVASSAFGSAIAGGV
jgi:hypothetical protein